MRCISLATKKEIELWKELVQEGKTKEAGEKYQKMFSAIMDRVEERASQQPDIDRLRGKCGLIITVGMNHEPIVLTHRALNPIKTYFLHTKDSESTVNTVIDFLNLSLDSFKRLTVANEVDVYSAVKNATSYLNENIPIAVDITGGTKPMSSGLTLAAAIRGFTVVYLQHEWYRGRPLPMSENIVILKNPYSIFGERVMASVVERFNMARFSETIILLEQTREKVADPRAIDLLKDYCELLKAWDRFDYERADDVAKKLNRTFKQYGILGTIQAILEDKLELINLLSKTHSLPFYDMLRNRQLAKASIADMFVNARRRSEFGMDDDATLRYYRTIELVSQYRLAANLSIDSADANSRSIRKATISRFHKILDKAKRKCRAPAGELPAELSLIDGMTLLLATKDQLIMDHIKHMMKKKTLNIDDEDFFMNVAKDYLKRLISVTEERNSLILVHGWNIQKPENKLREYAGELVQCIGPERYEEHASWLQKHKFPKLTLKMLDLDRLWSPSKV